MSKVLEALERIKREAGTPYFSTLYDIDMWREDFAIVETALKRLETLEEEKQSFDRQLEKKLKALEIMKEKKVDVAMFFESNNSVRHRKKLTPQEYDLLKEVLL